MFCSCRDEFWIYDFDNQVDEPVDIIEIKNLPERSSAFSFMRLSQKNSIFQNNQVEVTKEELNYLDNKIIELHCSLGTYYLRASTKLVLTN